MASRPSLRVVEFWPMTGFLGKPWLPEAGPDALVKSSRRVCERYSEFLRSHDLTMGVGRCRFDIEEQPDVDRVSVAVLARAYPPLDSLRVVVPPGVDALTADERALLSLEIIDATMSTLARYRGGSPAVIDDAKAYVLDHGLAFEEVSPWKTSPNRRLKARAAFEIRDDGSGCLRVQVCDRETADSSPDDHGGLRETAVLSQGSGYSDLFRRRAKSLRWRSTSDGGTVDSLGFWMQPPDEISLSDWSVGDTHVAPSRRIAEIEADTPLPVTVHVRDDPALEPEVGVRLGGGGPMNDVPVTYDLAHSRLSRVLEKPVLEWWRPAGGILDLEMRCGDVEHGVRVRRTKTETRVLVSRPTSSMSADDGPAQAREDVEAGLAAAAKRFALPPDFPRVTLDWLRDMVARELDERARYDAQMLTFLRSVRHMLPTVIYGGALEDVTDGMDVIGWLPNHLDLDQLTPEQASMMRELQEWKIA